MTQSGSVEAIVKDYILRECLPGEDPEQLAASTPLITSGILDSIATLKLVAFLERQFSISMEPHEADAEHLDTIELIAALVESKA